jgi:hypothetical protein
LASDETTALADGLATAVADGLDDAVAGDAVSDDAALGVGKTATVCCAGVEDAALTGSGVERRPAMARPIASTTTSANGRSVRAVETRRMTRRYGFFATVTTV